MNLISEMLSLLNYQEKRYIIGIAI